MVDEYNYQQRVIQAVAQHEKESMIGISYDIWESRGYLILLPKIEVNHHRTSLGCILVTQNDILGLNARLISELERLISISNY